MDDPTSLLLGLDEYVVVDVQRVDPKVVRVVIETKEDAAACPECGVWTTRVKDRPRCRIRDLLASGQRVELWCRKRRLLCGERLCGERLCPRRSFTQHTIQLPARARVTTRLRAKVAEAIAISNRAVTEVGREYGVGWHTAHQALVAAAAKWLPEPDPTPVLGIDETRARRVRWILEEAGWKRCDPWLTSFVDARPDAPGRLLGLAPGRSGQCVKDWLGEQTPKFRHAVEVVVIDPSAPYASGVRAALPQARIAVDHWHLVRLANQMVTDVRQRVTRQRHGRRGRKVDAAWAHRHLLLTAGDRLSAKQLTRLSRVFDQDDPTEEIAAAWACKELLRQLLAERDPDRVRHRLWRFYDACARVEIPEVERLATTIETWWPAIAVFLELGVTNARTEGYNRIIKQTKQVACGFRNIDNYQRRILAHIAVTRRDQPPA